MTVTESQNRLLHDQMLRIEQQRREIAHLRNEVAELEELLDLKDRLINEIFRAHTNGGGRAIRLEHSRLVNDGTPIVLCFEQIDNIDCTVLRAVR